MGNLIDVDEIKKRIVAQGPTKAIEDIWIGNIPYVDAVPVIRCEDCLYFMKMISFCKRHRDGTAPEGFCSEARKKDAEEIPE